MAKNKHETIKDLTLMLLYLTSWKDKELQDLREDVRTAWKGYDFDVLNELTDENLINGSGRGNKTAYLFKEGIEKAEDLLRKYGIEIEETK